MSAMERHDRAKGHPPQSLPFPFLLAVLAVFALLAWPPRAGAQDRPRAELPAYTLGEEWFRSDGAYELVRIEHGRYIFLAAEDREIQLTTELAMARAQRGASVMEFDPPPKLTWPLEVGASGSSQGTWRNPSNPGGRPATFAWGVDAYEDLQVPAGSFKAFRIHLTIGWTAGRGRGHQERSFQFTFWYAPEARRYVKARGERPGPLDFELTGLDRSGGPPLQAAGQGPAPTAASGAGKRYGLEFLDVLEAIKRGEGHEALRYYEGLAEKRERQGVRVEAAKAHSAVAFAALRLGAYQKAIRSGLRAVELFRQGPPSEEILGRQLSVYSHLGISFLQGGDRQEARRFLQEGLDLAKTSTNPQRVAFYSGVFSSGLTWVATLGGDYGGAVRHGEEAVRSLERYLGNLPPGPRFDKHRMNATRVLAVTLARLANAQRLGGSLPESEASARRAVAVSKSAGQPEAEMTALMALGWIASGRKDYAQSLARFQEAEAVAARAQLPAWNVHAGIGWSYAGQGRDAEALAAFQRAVDGVEDLRAELQEAELRSGFLEDKQGVYHGAVRSALALGRPAEAFGYAERARARAFLDLLGNQTVLSKGRTRALVDEEVRLRAQLSAAQALAQETGGEEEGSEDMPSARQQVEAAQRAYGAFLERVRRDNIEQASLMTVEPVTLQDVQGLLPENTTLLEYLVTPSETVLWVIDAQRTEVIRIPVARKDLVAQVRAFRRSIAEMAPLDVVKDRGRALYDRLLAPARAHLRGDRLLVVPHDTLHYLPFAALRTPEGRWIIEDYAVATLPSASVLKYLQAKGQGANAGALAVGNPDLGPALTLRYAEREARAVGAHYPGATVLVRQAATEPKVKALSGSAGVLHFATHAEMNQKDPLASALLLVPEAPDDGHLEVRKIFGLDLHARLVVLSACETGLGPLSKGDELVGLQRAFLYAGTPAVVTTLWKVDDRASYRLMEAFYDDLATRGPAEALRQAQRATMAEFPHPFAWAAFGLTGAPW